MFVFGMILGLPGTVLGQSETVEQFGLTLADRGLLISTLFAGLLVGSLLSGPLVDRMGQRAALVVSLSLVAVCLPLLAMAAGATVAASALLLLGLASASTNTASNALSSELFPHERGRRMNGIALMVGLGGLDDADGNRAGVASGLLAGSGDRRRSARGDCRDSCRCGQAR